MTGISVDTLEDKEQRAGGIIKEALSEKEGLFALYLGDMPGLVLLHMLRVAGGGRVAVPVINFQFMPVPGEALRFVDKLSRMWSIDLDVARFPERPGVGRYTEEEISKAIGGVLLKRGARSVISSWDSSSIVKDGFIEFMPLAGFSDEDISEYFRRRRLPTCSVDMAGNGGVGVGSASGRLADPENKKLADRLKKLGYL